MKDIRILFLAPNWRVSLLRSFKKSTAIKIFIVGADSDSHSAALNVVDKSYVIPEFSEPKCVEKIQAICAKENIHAILPMTNKAIDFMDKNRAGFDEGDLLLYLAAHTLIQISNNKCRLAEFFTQNNFASPDLIDPKKPFPGFPLIAKDPYGEGGRNCFKIEDQTEFDFYSKKLPNHIFQRFVQGREFSIDWFSNKKGLPVVVVPRERLVARAGEVMVSRIELIPDIIESAKRLGTRLQLRGPANLQGFLEESGEFLFTDINLRFGSGVLHTIHAGANIPEMMLQELVGESVEMKSNFVMDGSTMSRFHDAIFDS
ncbi:ATP-grasp domain-containing protein [Nitrospinaceae bacterium]|nr:ATP-grasp domain-containing protein [Nitrospinaceae bacterium]